MTGYYQLHSVRRIFTALLLSVLIAFTACSGPGDPFQDEDPQIEVDHEHEEGEGDHAHDEGEAGPDAGEGVLPEAVANPSELGLQGSLIFMQLRSEGQAVLAYEMTTGEISTLFQAPLNAWITGLVAIPETGQLALAYAPAPAEGQVQTGMTDLSVLPLNGGGEPQTILAHVGGEQSFSTPLWSGEEAYLYYGYYQVVADLFTYGIGRFDYPAGEKEIVIENAIWPRVSRDGRRLVFLGFEPGVGEGGLFTLDLTDENPVPQQVLLGEAFPIIDAPLFSPDGEMIYFTAVSQDTPTSGTIWDRLVGVQAAYAHDDPSDWWRIPVGGGEPERLTEIFETGMYADFSPDGEHFAFISSSGLHVMNPDGSELRTLVEINGLYGTLDWIP